MNQTVSVQKAESSPDTSDAPPKKKPNEALALSLLVLAVLVIAGAAYWDWNHEYQKELANQTEDNGYQEAPYFNGYPYDATDSDKAEIRARWEEKVKAVEESNRKHAKSRATDTLAGHIGGGLLAIVLGLGLGWAIVNAPKELEQIKNDPMLKSMAEQMAVPYMSVDTFQTRNGAVIVAWAVTPNMFSALSQFSDLKERDANPRAEPTPSSLSLQKQEIKSKFQEILQADPEADLAEYAPMFGAMIGEVKRSWRKTPPSSLDSDLQATLARINSLEEYPRETKAFMERHPELKDDKRELNRIKTVFAKRNAELMDEFTA